LGTEASPFSLLVPLLSARSTLSSRAVPAHRSPARFLPDPVFTAHGYSCPQESESHSRSQREPVHGQALHFLFRSCLSASDSSPCLGFLFSAPFFFRFSGLGSAGARFTLFRCCLRDFSGRRLRVLLAWSPPFLGWLSSDFVLPIRFFCVYLGLTESSS
jgi:hypothetical protein